MEDLSISKVAPFPGVKRLVHSKDGIILGLFKNDFIVLAPQPNAYSSNVSNRLTDYFSVLRLTGSLNKNDNVLKNLLAYDCPARLGEARSHTSANGIRVIRLSVSASGVSKTKCCMMLFVTDTMNGLLAKFEAGSFSVVKIINNELSSLESINLDNVLSSSELGKIRVRCLEWLKSFDYEFIKSPIWPVLPGSNFIVLTESNDASIFQFNDLSESIEKVYEFPLGSIEGEYSLECNVSDWSYELVQSKNIIYCYFTVITSENRLLLKKVAYKIDTNEYQVEACEENLNIKEPIVMSELVKLLNNNFALVVVTSRSLAIININAGVRIDAAFGCNVLLESMVNFRDANNPKVHHFLFSNTFGYISHVQLNNDHFNHDFHEYDYFNKIEGKSVHLPIFDKLNSLNSDSDEKYVIDTMATDPTGTFIEFTYYNINFNTKVNFSSTKKEPLMFALVKAMVGSKVNFDNVSDFNTIQTNPPYWRSMYQLELALENGQPPNEFIGSALNASAPVVKQEEGVDEDMDTGDSESDNEDNDRVYADISEEMFLNRRLEKLRVESCKSVSLLTKETKLKVLKRLAAAVVSMVQNGSLHTTSEYDMFMFLQYCKLLGKNVAPGTVCKMAVEHMADVHETFLAESFSIDPVEGLPSTIESIEGHQWGMCEVTMLPILGPEVRRCSHCRVKRGSPGHCQLAASVLALLPLCIYCGGRFL